MKFNAFIFILLTGITFTVVAQDHIQTEDEDKLYWQPDVEIDYSHFQSESDADCIKYKEEYDFDMSASIDLIGIVDIPKSHLSRRIKKRKGDDRLYLAPVFCKDCSCILSEDSVELETIQLLFDVAEMCARGVRKDLADAREEMNINNVNTMLFTTVKNKWDGRMKDTWGSIFQDVLIQKKDSAYMEWRQVVDEILESLSDFATQPYEIERLISGKPTEEGYVQAKSITGDLRPNDDN